MPKRRTTTAKHLRWPRRLALAALAAVLLAALLVGVLWVTLPDPVPLARENPKTTAMIEHRRAEARQRRRTLRVRQSWVSLERISPALVNAVLLSEDAKFFGHEGFDWEAMRAAAERNVEKGRYAAGASTITQQLAKNLWLGTEKTLTRKAKEAILAVKLERSLEKRRILALYLNVAEFGEGVFGIEAGAQLRFGTSAAALTPAQAAVMAAMLPAPRRVDLAHPSTWLARRSRRVLDRLRDAGRITAEAHLSASAELERILAGPRPVDDVEEPPEDDAPGEERADAAPAGRGAGAAPDPGTAPVSPLPSPGASAAADQGAGTGTVGQDAVEKAQAPSEP